MITASLIGGVAPQNVQIVVDTTPAGVLWTLTGSTGGHSWTVPSGMGIGDGQQLALVDNRAPGNVPVVYTFATGSTSESSLPVIVPFSGDFVLQTLTGSRSLTLRLLKGSLETHKRSGQESYRVAGRRRPVVRYDVTGDVEGTLVLLVEAHQMSDFDDMLASGEPLLYRLGTEIMDLAPVAVFTYGDVVSVAYPSALVRAWSMPYAIVDDPYLDVRLGGFAWDFFDEVWETQPWDVFDAQIAGVSWDDFDTFDWSTL